MIVVVDFGSQTTHLIARRLSDLGITTEIITPEQTVVRLKTKNIKGIILSGGPASVYQKNAPTIDPQIFSYGVPLLGICYGLQLMAKLLGGKVIQGKKEYGPARLRIKNNESRITNSIDKESIVWMSHGDEVVKLPDGFKVLGSTKHVPFAFVSFEEKQLFGVQFHPEVEHTTNGIKILENFIAICQSKKTDKGLNIEEMKENIREKVGKSYVIGAVSGGVDSTVAGVLTARAIGKQFIPVYVDNGLMRERTGEHVRRIFLNESIRPIILSTVGETLAKLRGRHSPEEKRKVIGSLYINHFEAEMARQIKLGKMVKYLLQGTIYSDVIESQGSKHAAKIKSHHNVGGLPKHMKLRLLEPLRELYKDQVRSLGNALGIPKEFVYKQPFPGPGYAIRIRGEVTSARLKKAKIADAIILEELGKADLLGDIFLSFPVLTGALSTAVKGDGRFFGEVIALRVVQSQDVMTSTWARLPYDVLQTISSRIVNEVPGISRVVYDITTKPPATMEWE